MNTDLPSPLPFPARGARGGGGRREREEQEACQKEGDAGKVIATVLNKRRFFMSTEGGAERCSRAGERRAEKIYRMVEKKGARPEKRGRGEAIRADIGEKNKECRGDEGISTKWWKRDRHRGSREMLRMGSDVQPDEITDES